MLSISERVEAISVENKTITVSVDKIKESIGEIIRQQNEFNSKHEEIIRQQNEFNSQYEKIISLANSLQEKDNIISQMQARIEALEADNKKAKDRNEELEQHGRKMNLWFYGVDEEENEDSRQALRKSCVNVLKMKGSVIDNWLIKNTHRVGAFKTPKRPIIVAFVLWEERQILLRA